MALKRTRKLTDAVMAIMTSDDVAIMQAYKQSQQHFQAEKLAHEKQRDAYYAMIDRLNAVFEPEINAVYESIEELTNDYLLATPRDKVYDDVVQKRGYSVSPAKFGRMMKEYGFYRTTVRVNGEVQSRWRSAQ